MNKLDAITKLTGIKSTDIQAIAAAVKANRDALQSCKRHDFEPDGNPNIFRRKYVCRNCGGKVDPIVCRFYELGLMHGREEAK